jgi:hypothetical protein
MSNNKKTAFIVTQQLPKKNGKKGLKQLYKCFACGKQFVGGNRLNFEQIWKEYLEGKQTSPEQ